jgi:hypothetical protein
MHVGLAVPDRLVAPVWRGLQRFPRAWRFRVADWHSDTACAVVYGIEDGYLVRAEFRRAVEQSRLGYVTRARMTQIMGLLNLAPDIQDALLNFGEAGEEIRERQLRPIVAIANWREQRQHWLTLKNVPPVVSPASLDLGC